MWIILGRKEEMRLQLRYGCEQNITLWINTAKNLHKAVFPHKNMELWKRDAKTIESEKRSGVAYYVKIA